MNTDMTLNTDMTNWSHYPVPLPKIKEHHFTESTDGPKIEGFSKANLNYLMDQSNKIVGFTVDGKKFIFSNVIYKDHKILPDAQFEIAKDDIDLAIKEYLVMNENPRATYFTTPHHHSATIRSDIDPLTFINQPHDFTKLPGKEYGISEQSYRGAPLLENKHRLFIGFRYHGKDFFVDTEKNKLSRKYKPEMLWKFTEKETLEQFVDKYLELTELGLKHDPSAKEVKLTQDILNTEIQDLYTDFDQYLKKKEEFDNKLQELYERRLKGEYQAKDNVALLLRKYKHLEPVRLYLENKIETIKNDIEKLSKFEPSETKQEETSSSKSTKQLDALLHDISKTDDIKTLYEQYQHLKDIDGEELQSKDAKHENITTSGKETEKEEPENMISTQKKLIEVTEDKGQSSELDISSDEESISETTFDSDKFNESELNKLNTELSDSLKLLNSLIKEGREIRTASISGKKIDFKALSENTKKIKDINKKLLMLQNKRKMIFDEMGKAERARG